MNSKDLLNYSLSLAVIAVAFFTCWILIYIVRIFREVQKVIRDVTSAMEKLNGLVDHLRDKVSGFAAMLPLITKGIEKIVDLIRSRAHTDDSGEPVTGKNRNKK